MLESPDPSYLRRGGRARLEVNVVPHPYEMVPYGSLQVKEENGEYHIIVKPDAVHGGDLSCKYFIFVFVRIKACACTSIKNYTLCT